jgi:hypothetical protein
MSMTSRISGTRRLERRAELRMMDTPGRIPDFTPGMQIRLWRQSGDPVYTSVLAGISRYFGEFCRNQGDFPTLSLS